jgi:hypothetical protein
MSASYAVNDSDFQCSWRWKRSGSGSSSKRCSKRAASLLVLENGAPFALCSEHNKMRPLFNAIDVSPDEFLAAQVHWE